MNFLSQCRSPVASLHFLLTRATSSSHLPFFVNYSWPLSHHPVGYIYIYIFFPSGPFLCDTVTPAGLHQPTCLLQELFGPPGGRAVSSLSSGPCRAMVVRVRSTCSKHPGWVSLRRQKQEQERQLKAPERTSEAETSRRRTTHSCGTCEVTTPSPSLLQRKKKENDQ